MKVEYPRGPNYTKCWAFLTKKKKKKKKKKTWFDKKRVDVILEDVYVAEITF